MKITYINVSNSMVDSQDKKRTGKAHCALSVLMDSFFINNNYLHVHVSPKPLSFFA